jgi:manganese transport protein
MGQRRRWSAGQVPARPQSPVTLIGPAFVAAVAYIDPGNFATNTVAGATRGYELMWVVLGATVMGVLAQYLSAKLGLATGRSLARLCRDRWPRPVVVALWLQAEAVAMATDVAEVIGGAIALNLLFDLPLLIGGVVTAVVAFAILGLRGAGARPYEIAVAGLIGLVVVGFAVSVVWTRVDPGAALTGMVVPHLGGQQAFLLAAGITGATVMPHVIYLHSSITAERVTVAHAEPRSLLRAQRVDLPVAMGAAGFVNLAIVATSAAVLHTSGAQGETLTGAFDAYRELVGVGIALLFASALLASAFASSSVGTHAGQVVLGGFLGVRIPLWLRRVITVLPALAIIGLEVDPTQALVISQVVLSFGIPFATIPLVWFTSRPSVMGEFVNRRGTTLAGWALTGLVLVTNVLLLVDTFS